MSYEYCDKHNIETFYHEGYDAHFCVLCNEWTETQCSDKHCNFCYLRPCQPIDSERYKVFIECYDKLGIKALKELVQYYFELYRTKEI